MSQLEIGVVFFLKLGDGQPQGQSEPRAHFFQNGGLRKFDVDVKKWFTADGSRSLLERAVVIPKLGDFPYSLSKSLPLHSDVSRPTPPSRSTFPFTILALEPKKLATRAPSIWSRTHASSSTGAKHRAERHWHQFTTRNCSLVF